MFANIKKELMKFHSGAGVNYIRFSMLTPHVETISHRSVSTTAEFLLTTKNKNRCVECMKTPPVGINLNQTLINEKALAAVLIPICVNPSGETSILYTRRSGQLSRHVRQISFPGGIKDATDADFVECALRETEEEIGLPRSRIHVWGTGSLLTPPHTAAIMPVFGTIENFNIKNLIINTDEVEEAFVIPISRMIAPDSLRHTQFKSGFSSPVYLVGKYKIWGITGYITHKFLNCFIPNEKNRAASNVIKYVRPFRH